MNHLQHETSPYLLQHAHNPVDWYPWGDEAFERAQRENKPIFLSIGYAACHWCHVMERETFENEAIAQWLNDYFVCIKVDREERPDVDAIYMTSVQLMAGMGGWPLSVFLTPDRKPFFGGTYFPPTDRQGMPGFRRLIEEIARLWRGDNAAVMRTANDMKAALERFCNLALRGTADSALTRNIFLPAFRDIAAAFDGDFAGFGRAPKFPQPTTLAFLLRYASAFREPHALAMVELTLEAMARGGIYDQIGGGFHRYATDARWLIPHFEKMLTDNALLAQVYLDAWRLTGKPLYERIARETLDFVLREMTHPAGGFFSSLDADNGEGEGAFYVWSAEELQRAVGQPNAEILLRHFGIEAIGNFEGDRSVLSAASTAEEIARQLGREPNEIESAIAAGRRTLFEWRRNRPAPPADDKIVAASNGLMISALAQAGSALETAGYIEAACRAADFVLSALRRDDGGLWRSWREGQCRAQGFLTDYAYLAGGLIDLYEATFDPRWLEEAIGLAENIIARFWDENDNGFFLTEQAHEPLVVRPKDSYDNPEPSGNAAAVMDLLRLSEITERESWRKEAVETLRLFGPLMVRSAPNMGQMLSALDFHTASPRTVVIAGEPGNARTQALIRAARHPYSPNKVLLLANIGDRKAFHALLRLAPALEGKTAPHGEALAYVCRGRTCGAPIADPAALSLELKNSVG
ncbi:MAG: thioredoxin domain-containing protein [Candidatus Sumerlaeia bacterium]|nr:thioredoxin domain-containing protein [Candidatus Sumerlaeia bacterium]